MDYNDLQIVLKQKGLQLDDLCKDVGITVDGLRKGFKNNSLALRYIKPLCIALGITPNELIGWETAVGGSNIYAANISGVNNQNSGEAIVALKDELKEQRAIIKEKENQINRLITIIEKNKSK